ncbi:TVP38/TMEM64 family protein [Mesobacillus foraminis]|uniref:TVP38/TMEM64 family protein n=1 Tax=Mesobacillus foraminis TaxID=279826 RepID=UPI001BE9072F|nr:VTT domain-containing protein [Mesobacillus foraminis]MBT2756832.1 TVP38/TMEM64 family protein [Mesobacillus foraminis]
MEFLIDTIGSEPILFILVSLCLNSLIAISGVLPSAFLTAANILVLGFANDLILSIAGEALGGVISFFLYRKGLAKIPAYKKNIKFMETFLNRLRKTGGIEAVFLVLLLRTLPFIPSGLVTLTAAYSEMGIFAFALASTAGKIPALYIEAYSINVALNVKTEWQIGTLVALILLFTIWVLWKRSKGK